MKIRTERKALAETLAWVAQAIPKKASMPALAGIRITAGDCALTLRGFDYDVSHTATIDAETMTAGECLAPASFLVTFVGQMRGDTVELVLEGDSLTISTGRSTYRTRVLRLDDYPALPDQAPPVGIVDAGALGEAVTDCRRAAAADGDPTKILKAISLTGDASGLRLMATNRFLVIDRHVDWNHRSDLAAIPLARMLDEAVRGMVGEVLIGAHEGLLSLAANRRIVTMRQLQGDYPRLDGLIAKLADPDFTVTVEAGDLAQAVARAGKLSDGVIPVSLDFADSAINLSIAATEGGDGAEEVDCESTGAGEALYSARVLADGLQSMPPGPVVLGVTVGRVVPTIIRPLDDDGSRLALVHVKRAAGAR